MKLLVALLFLLPNIFLSCQTESTSATTSETDTAQVPEIKDTATGLASFYGRRFEGKKSASGEIFHRYELVAAHPTYPFGTLVRITNLENNDTVRVRIIDRGPTTVNQKEGVIIDLSKGTAEKLRMVKDGRIQVKVEVLEWGRDSIGNEKN